MGRTLRSVTSGAQIHFLPARIRLAGAEDSESRCSASCCLRHTPSQLNKLRYNSLLDDIFLLSYHKRQQVVLLGLRNLVLVESCHQMFRRRIPVGLCNTQALMRGPHFTSRINARTAGRHAELVEFVLAHSLLLVVTEPGKKFCEAFVGARSHDKVIDTRRDRIVSTQPRAE